MSEKLKAYGSLLVIIAFVISGSIAVGMFFAAEWLLDRLGPIGLAVELVVINACAILANLYDLPGNARKVFE